MSIINIAKIIVILYHKFNYDPKSAKMRGGQVYVHQRMDFLILISDTHRVVIEIYG